MTIEKNEIQPLDISQEFLNMSPDDFYSYLRQLRNEPILVIEIDWVDKYTARRLKAFIEDSDALRRKQKRIASIRATKEQFMEDPNAFASGVKWIEVKK